MVSIFSVVMQSYLDIIFLGFSRIPEREWFPIVCCGDSTLKKQSSALYILSVILVWLVQS